MNGRGLAGLVAAAMLAKDGGGSSSGTPRHVRKIRSNSIPGPHTRERENERRRRQIERGQLRAENGLREGGS